MVGDTAQAKGAAPNTSGGFPHTPYGFQPSDLTYALPRPSDVEALDFKVRAPRLHNAYTSALLTPSRSATSSQRVGFVNGGFRSHESRWGEWA
jgi:hypothetical protein